MLMDEATYQSMVDQVLEFVPAHGREIVRGLVNHFRKSIQQSEDCGFGRGWRLGHEHGLALGRAQTEALVELARECGRVEAVYEAGVEAGETVVRVCAERESAECAEATQGVAVADSAMTKLEADLAAGKIRPS